MSKGLGTDPQHPHSLIYDGHVSQAVLRFIICMCACVPLRELKHLVRAGPPKKRWLH